MEPLDKTIRIIDGEVYKTTNDGKGKVVYFEGLLFESETTFGSKKSTVTYKITIKNESNESKAYTGIEYNKESGVKYTVSGIKEGEILSPGETKVVYLIVENDGAELNVPINTTVSFDFVDFGVSTKEQGIYLINQFPTKDEVGKQFQGKNYVFTFSLILGKKTEGAYYELTAVPLAESNLNPNYVKLYLEKNKQGVDMSYRPNGRVKVFSEYSKSEHEGTEGKVIYKDYITKDDVKNGKIDFVMRMWVSEDVDINDMNKADYMNKKFVVRVNTYAQFPND